MAEQEQHTPDCECFSKHDGDIVYCPMHKVAPAMLKGLEVIQRRLFEAQNMTLSEMGHEVGFCDDHARLLIAQARPSVAGQEVGK